ncbi:MAG: FIST C-terminal domain-containing protein [Thermodesulfovibrionales bacterium]|nr:FIST C-terminal domain-containing protein [Thermodesulfovibrionales bacterium]
MGTYISTGVSALPDPYLAANEGIRNALTKINPNLFDKANKLVISLITQEYDPYWILKGIKENIDTSNIIGFTTAGFFTNDTILTKGVLIAIIISDEMEFFLNLEKNLSKDPKTVSYQLAKKITEILPVDDINALLILMPDAISSTVSVLVETLYDFLGAKIKYVGGGSGDNLRFLKTFQFTNDEIASDTVASALILTHKPIGISVYHGWQPISPPFVVTKAKGNIIYELDWQNAFDVYKDFIENYDKNVINYIHNEFAKTAINYPLGISLNTNSINYIVRDLIKTINGSLVCVGDVPENSVIRIMTSNYADLISEVKPALTYTKKQLYNNHPIGALVFYCVSRYLLSKELLLEEISLIKEALGNAPIIGCLSFGEIGSIESSIPEYHNKSVAICFFS